MSTRKYAFFQVFTIPPEGLKISDEDSPDLASKHSAQPQSTRGQNAKPSQVESALQPGPYTNVPSPEKSKDRAQLHTKQLEAFDQYVKRHEQEFRTSPFALQISAICHAKRTHFAQSMFHPPTHQKPNETAAECH